MRGLPDLLHIKFIKKWNNRPYVKYYVSYTYISPTKSLEKLTIFSHFTKVKYEKKLWSSFRVCILKHKDRALKNLCLNFFL